MNKDIDELLSHAGHLTPEEAGKLAKLIGRNKPELHIEESDLWEDSILQEYADYIYNYLYTYKQEATKIDSSIDPNEEHVGPMAQDIEKVAPDCIIEKNGVKTVDGNRLALINAGAIADLARKLEEVMERLKKLEGE